MGQLLEIVNADLRNVGNVLAETIRSCASLTKIKIIRNRFSDENEQQFSYLVESIGGLRLLKELSISGCGIDAHRLLTLIHAIQGNRSLEMLNLDGNRIGDAGCETLSTLLADPHSNLQLLSLISNDINTMLLPIA